MKGKVILWHGRRICPLKQICGVRDVFSFIACVSAAVSDRILSVKSWRGLR